MPGNGLQTPGDWVLAALEQRADGAANAARPMVTALRERDWEGDVELADQLDALLLAEAHPDRMAYQAQPSATLPDRPLWYQLPVNSRAVDYNGLRSKVPPGQPPRRLPTRNRSWTIRTTSGSARAQR